MIRSMVQLSVRHGQNLLFGHRFSMGLPGDVLSVALDWACFAMIVHGMLFVAMLFQTCYAQDFALGHSSLVDTV